MYHSRGIPASDGVRASILFRCVELIKEKFDTILMPVHHNKNHYVVAEMRLVSPRGVKVWDGMCQRGEGRYWRNPFLDSFMQVIYGKGWEQIPVVVERHDQDPCQPIWGHDGRATQCCGALVSLTLANLAKGIRPSGYNDDDDATIRSWMLASIQARRLIALPQRRTRVHHREGQVVEI